MSSKEARTVPSCKRNVSIAYLLIPHTLADIVVGSSHKVVVHRKRKFNEISGISQAIECGGRDGSFVADMNKSVALPPRNKGAISALNHSAFTDQ